jgi:GNAT superfamily N-acetyltransferase
MDHSKKPETLFNVEVIPQHQFHLISSMAPFTRGQKREAIVYAHLLWQGEQINLVVKDRRSSDIAGCAVLRARPYEMVIVDFYILERYRYRGVGRILVEKIEALARQKGLGRINTGKSLHSDNKEMIGFCQKIGFIKLPMEIYYFYQPLRTQEKRLHRFCSQDLSRFLPENNRIVPFTEDYFEPVYEAAVELLLDDPSYSETLMYQTLLVSSEKYSHILVQGSQVNGFAICSATGKNLHLNFIAIRDELRHLGLPMFLIGTGLCRAYRDGKTTFSYIAYKTDKLFKDIHQIFQNPGFVVIQMEKTIL